MSLLFFCVSMAYVDYLVFLLLFIHPSIHPSTTYLPIRPSIYPSVHLSTHPPIHPPIPNHIPLPHPAPLHFSHTITIQPNSRKPKPSIPPTSAPPTPLTHPPAPSSHPHPTTPNFRTLQNPTTTSPTAPTLALHPLHFSSGFYNLS